MNATERNKVYRAYFDECRAASDVMLARMCERDQNELEVARGANEGPGRLTYLDELAEISHQEQSDRQEARQEL